MPVDPITGEIKAQPLNDNFSSLQSEMNEYKMETVTEITNVKTGFGAEGDGTNDDTEAIQSALDNGNIIYFPSGTYRITSPITINRSNIKLIGDNVILEFSDVTENNVFRIKGSITETSSNLSVDSVKGSNTIELATGEGSKYSVGDWIRIRSEAGFNDDNATKLGEIQKISSISGDEITLEGYLLDSYSTTDTASIDLLNMLEKIAIRGIAIIATGAKQIVRAEQVYALNINNCILKGDNATHGILMYDVVGAQINNNKIENITAEGLGYGVDISNASRNVVVSSNSINNCRRAVKHGGDVTYGVNRSISVVGNTVYNDAERSVEAFDCHNTAEGVTFSGNSVIGHGLAQINGKFIEVIGNTAVRHTEHRMVNMSFRSKYCSLVGNTIYAYGETNGAINVMGENNIVSNNIVRAHSGRALGTSGDISRNNKIIGNIFHSNSSIRFISPGSEKTVNLEIINNQFISEDNIGVEFRFSPGFDFEGVRFEGNHIKSTARGLYINANVAQKIINLVLLNNVIEAGSYGVMINENTVEGLFMQNNTIKDASVYGLWVMGTDAINHACRFNQFINCGTDIEDDTTDVVTLENLSY